MARIRYARANSTAGPRVVTRDDGAAFDIEAALSGAGNFIVDDSVFPQLVVTLDANPRVQRSGGEGAVAAPNAVVDAPPTIGIELGYAESISTFTTSSTSAVDVPAMAITVTVRQRPFNVEFWCRNLQNDSALGFASPSIVEGAAVVASCVAGDNATGATNARWPGYLRRRRSLVDAPSGSQRAYKIQLAAVSAGNAQAAAAAISPMCLQALEV